MDLVHSEKVISGEIILAPMLGITDASFRTAFETSYGGFDGAISPFVRTLQGQRFKESGVRDLVPSLNQSLSVTPQIMSNSSEDFIPLAKILFDMGYELINLNMGCPVPTAAGRARGAGLIVELERVDQFLEDVLSKIPNRLSIKTRVGLRQEDELLPMLEVFNRYPLDEIIVHPRTAEQKYSGSVNHDMLHEVCSRLKHPVVYSGDIWTEEDFVNVQRRHPSITKWMIGRGALRDPNIVRKIRGQSIRPCGTEQDFLRHLAELYRAKDFSDHVIMGKLKVFLLHFGIGHDFSKKLVKSLRKAKDLSQLLDEFESGFNIAYYK